MPTPDEGSLRRLWLPWILRLRGVTPSNFRPTKSGRLSRIEGRPWQCGFCNLQNRHDGRETESLSLRQYRSFGGTARSPCERPDETDRAAEWREQPGRTVLILRAPWHAQRPLGDISDRLTVCRSPAFESEALSYRRSSRPSSSSAIPDTVPVSCPVSVKKTGLLKASAKTGCAVSVNVRRPDASRKRPVPPLT